MGKKEQAEESLKSLVDKFPDCIILQTGAIFWEFEEGLRMKSPGYNSYLIQSEEINENVIIGAMMQQFEESLCCSRYWIERLSVVYRELTSQ